jgi:hypothetical protein
LDIFQRALRAAREEWAATECNLRESNRRTLRDQCTRSIQAAAAEAEVKEALVAAAAAAVEEATVAKVSEARTDAARESMEALLREANSERLRNTCAAHTQTAGAAVREFLGAAPTDRPAAASDPGQPRMSSGQGLTLFHSSAQCEHFLFDVVRGFAGLGDKNGSG